MLKTLKAILLSLWIITLLAAMPYRVMASSVQADSISDSSRIILEISDYGAGMVNYQGEKLFCRLYGDGRFQYEVLPKYRPNAGRKNYVLIKKEMRLSKNQVSEIVNLAEQSDFLQAKDKYSELHSLIDAVFVKTIIYRNTNREKKIEIRNYDSSEVRAASYYPQSLVKLLQKLTEIIQKED